MAETHVWSSKFQWRIQISLLLFVKWYLEYLDDLTEMPMKKYVSHSRNLQSLIFIRLILKLISMVKNMHGKVSRNLFSSWLPHISIGIVFNCQSNCQILHLFTGINGNTLFYTWLFMMTAWSSVGVALLPFVDEKRLLSALETVYPDLTEDERK